MIRWSGFSALLVIAAIIVGTVYFLTDDWIEEQIEYQASYYNGARFEIDDLDISFLGLHLKWNRLQVTDPAETMKNTFETGRSSLDLAFLPLIYSSVVVEDMSLTGIQTNTDRETDGAMDFPEVDEEPGIISQTASRLTNRAKENAQVSFSNFKTNINTDSLVNQVNLQTPERVDSVKNEINQKFESWQQQIDTTRMGSDLKKLRANVENIKPNEIKSPQKAKEAVESLKSLRQTTDSLQNSIKTARENLTSDITSTSNMVSQVDEWIKQDIQRAQDLAQLPEISAQNIGQNLFGESFINSFNTYLGYAKQARDFAEAMQPESGKPKPKRSEGRNVTFSDKYDYPGIWIKRIDLSGNTQDGLHLSGLVENVVSDQQKIGETTTLDLTGEGANGRSLQLTGLFDYLSNDPGETFDVEYANFPMGDVKLSNSDLMPNRLESGSGTVTASLEMRKKSLNSNINFIINNTEFIFSDNNEADLTQLQQLVQKTVKNTDTITMNANISGQEGDLDFKLSSNLDNEILNSLRATVSEKVAEARQKIRNEVESRLAEKRSELEDIVAEKQEELKEKLLVYEDRLNSEKEKIEAKREELQNKVKGKLKDKVKDKFDF